MEVFVYIRKSEVSWNQRFSDIFRGVETEQRGSYKNIWVLNTTKSSLEISLLILKKFFSLNAII